MRWTAQHRVWLLGILILVGASVAGCESDESATAPGESTSPASGGKQLETLPGEGGSVKGKNACGSAVIRLGSKPGAIEFVARCSGRKEGGVAFIIQSVMFEKKLQFVDYTRMPSVRGAGAVSQRGKCSIEQAFISCNATIDGPAVVSGAFSVKGDPCAAPISVVGITSPSCRGSDCFGDPLLDGLFRSKPRGCAGTSG